MVVVHEGGVWVCVYVCFSVDPTGAACPLDLIDNTGDMASTKSIDAPPVLPLEIKRF